jgi:hypothetical protein
MAQGVLGRGLGAAGCGDDAVARDGRVRSGCCQCAVPPTNLVYTTVAVFTNQFEKTRDQAVAVSPISGQYTCIRHGPRSSWTMSDQYKRVRY